MGKAPRKGEVHFSLNGGMQRQNLGGSRIKSPECILDPLKWGEYLIEKL